MNGAKISASSISKELLNELRKEIHFTVVNPDNLFQTNCDIVSPCALGKAINVKNRNQLMDAMYGENIYVDDRTIDSHIKRLRKKFRLYDSTFDQIRTRYGSGYSWRE